MQCHVRTAASTGEAVSQSAYCTGGTVNRAERATEEGGRNFWIDSRGKNSCEKRGRMKGRGDFIGF